MGILQRFFNPPPHEKPKTDTPPPITEQEGLQYLRSWKGDPVTVRKMMLAGSKMTMREIIESADVDIAESTFYAQLLRPTNRAAAGVLAAKLGVRCEDLFPELESCEGGPLRRVG